MEKTRPKRRFCRQGTYLLGSVILATPCSSNYYATPFLSWDPNFNSNMESGRLMIATKIDIHFIHTHIHGKFFSFSVYFHTHNASSIPSHTGHSAQSKVKGMRLSILWHRSPETTPRIPLRLTRSPVLSNPCR